MDRPGSQRPRSPRPLRPWSIWSSPIPPLPSVSASPRRRPSPPLTLLSPRERREKKRSFLWSFSPLSLGERGAGGVRGRRRGDAETEGNGGIGHRLTPLASPATILNDGSNLRRLPRPPSAFRHQRKGSGEKARDPRRGLAGVPRQGTARQRHARHRGGAGDGGGQSLLLLQGQRGAPRLRPGGDPRRAPRSRGAGSGEGPTGRRAALPADRGARRAPQRGDARLAGPPGGGSARSALAAGGPDAARRV